MSTQEKVTLCRQTWQDSGLKRTLAALDLPKASWYYHQRHKINPESKYAHVRPVLEEIAREHPEYGYRRTQVELGETYGIHLNHKLVQQLHRLWGLPLLRNTRVAKPSATSVVSLSRRELMSRAAAPRTMQ